MLPRASTTAEDPVTQKAGPLRLPIQGQRKRGMNKCERTSVNYGAIFTETTCAVLEPQKVKRRRKGQRLYFKK